MVEKIKTKLCGLIKQLGYNITDNGAYVENFPWLMARLNGYNRIDTIDTRIEEIYITIDIFSKYKIVEDINNHLQEIRRDNAEIIYISQYDLKILDDNKTGPVKKHGVLTYQFILSSNLMEEDATDDTEGN